MVTGVFGDVDERSSVPELDQSGNNVGIFNRAGLPELQWNYSSKE
jgi:hypothetical protein